MCSNEKKKKKKTIIFKLSIDILVDVYINGKQAQIYYPGVMVISGRLCPSRAMNSKLSFRGIANDCNFSIVFVKGGFKQQQGYPCTSMRQGPLGTGCGVSIKQLYDCRR